MKKAKRVSSVLVLAVVVACADHPTTPEGVANPAGVPPPDLSAPQRWRPALGTVTVTPATVKEGEVALLTADVAFIVPGDQLKWAVVADVQSIGNGVLVPWVGTGPLRSEFHANYKGEVSLLVYAVDSRGVPAPPVRARLSVVR